MYVPDTPVPTTDEEPLRITATSDSLKLTRAHAGASMSSVESWSWPWADVAAVTAAKPGGEDDMEEVRVDLVDGGKKVAAACTVLGARKADGGQLVLEVESGEDVADRMKPFMRGGGGQGSSPASAAPAGGALELGNRRYLV